MTLISFESFEYFIFVCDMLNKADEGSKDYINSSEAVVRYIKMRNCPLNDTF